MTLSILLVIWGKYSYWWELFNSLKTTVLGTEPSLLLTITDLQIKGKYADLPINTMYGLGRKRCSFHIAHPAGARDTPRLAEIREPFQEGVVLKGNENLSWSSLMNSSFSVLTHFICFLWFFFFFLSHKAIFFSLDSPRLTVFLIVSYYFADWLYTNQFFPQKKLQLTPQWLGGRISRLVLENSTSYHQGFNWKLFWEKLIGAKTSVKKHKMQGTLLISVYLKERQKKRLINRNIEQEINKIITATPRLKGNLWNCPAKSQNAGKLTFNLNYNMLKMSKRN